MTRPPPPAALDPAPLRRPTPRAQRRWPARGPARLLLASRDPTSLASAAERLARTPYATRVAIDRSAALALARSWRPHLVVADARLVDPALLAAVATAPTGARSVPLLALVEDGSIPCRVAAFEAGADDVLSLPVLADELLARIRSLLRRSYALFTPLAGAVRTQRLSIDLAQRSARLADAELPLAPLEFSLLYLLAERGGRAVSRVEIREALWGPESAGGSNVVDSAVRRLRARLADDWRAPRLVATVRGVGYRLVDDEPGAGRTGRSGRGPQPEERSA